MASYFDEHDCKPLRDGERPNHLLHLARLLFDVGLAFEGSFQSYLGDEKLAPPASKKAVEELPTVTMNDGVSQKSCAVCLAAFEADDKMRRMPCKHHFHDKCILPWLKQTNSCPMCRHELPTDDKTYEEYKQHKAREAQRKYDLETLHDSMFG